MIAYDGRQQCRELEKVPLPKGESHQKPKKRGAKDGSVHEMVAPPANYGEAVPSLCLLGYHQFLFVSLVVYTWAQREGEGNSCSPEYLRVCLSIASYAIRIRHQVSNCFLTPPAAEHRQHTAPKSPNPFGNRDGQEDYCTTI